MSEKGLFTVGLIAYNEKDYLYEALDSVLGQTYGQIELIVADDGTPGFDCSVYETYIEEHKGANIKSYAVYTREKNVGTVKNCNFAVNQAKGKYLLLFAADDALYDAHVIETFADEFEKRGPECKILTAPVAVCADSLLEVTQYVPDDQAREFVKKSTPRELFSKLAGTYLIQAGGTCYRTSLFTEIGGFDEDYALMEDAPFFIRLAKLGYDFGWVDATTAIRHRDGGVSHGNSRGHAQILKKYYGDEILFYEKEVIPYKHLIEKESYKLAMEKYGYAIYHYYSMFVKHEQSLLQRLQFMKKHGCLEKVVIRKAKETGRPFYELLQRLHGSLFHLSFALFLLYMLCQKTDEKRKYALKKWLVFINEMWILLELCSTIKPFLERWKKHLRKTEEI